jgi:hypothetical protein
VVLTHNRPTPHANPVPSLSPAIWARWCWTVSWSLTGEAGGSVRSFAGSPTSVVFDEEHVSGPTVGGMAVSTPMHTGCANCGTPTGRGGTLRGPDRAWWSCCQACTDLVVDQMEVVDDRPDGCPIIGLYHNPPERAVVLAVGRTGGSVSSLEVPRRSEGSPAMTFLRRLQPEQSDRALHGQRDHMNRASAGFDHGSNT